MATFLMALHRISVICSALLHSLEPEITVRIITLHDSADEILFALGGTPDLAEQEPTLDRFGL